MKSKKQKAWIIVGDDGRPYVGWHFTKKMMIQHHIDAYGYMNWKQAYDKGDRCIKAVLTYR